MSGGPSDSVMAYLDGALDPAGRAALEADPAAMAEIAALRRQGEVIRALYEPVAAESVPTRLDPHRLALVHQRRSWRGLAQAAAVVLLVGAGVAVGWLARPADTPELYDRLIADAVSAHTVYVGENRHAVEVPGSDTAHLTSWLSSRLETPLAMPNLSEEGLSFLGGRLLPAPAVPGGRAAQLMYQDPNGERVTLYITPAIDAEGPTYETVRLGIDTALYLAGDTLTCTIVGNQPVPTLDAIARSVATQLAPADYQML